ncbi:MAG TPA: SpoIIE family protein phosphatase [Thermoanaerobaculia bacterium]|nr:SpoIIE family protein phosphatase [Thermoanaerobaculia bacterium]
MKIRTQLLLACFILSVVPLTGIVFYSYRSSKLALENAYRQEGARLTAQMDGRLNAIRSELDQRLAGLSAMPLNRDNVMMTMSDVAPLVDALEFVPAPAPSPAPSAASRIATAAPIAAIVPHVVTPAPPEPPEPDLTEPVVIHVPPVKVPAFALPPDFNEKIAQIAGLSQQLSAASPEEREALSKQLDQKQAELHSEMETIKENFHEQLQAAQEQRKAQIEMVQQARETPRVVKIEKLTKEQRDQIKQKERQAALLFGQKFNVSLQSGGAVVGQLRAQLSTDEVLKRVLGSSDDDGEIPFVVDREGTLYTRKETDRGTLENLGIAGALKKRQPLPRTPNWVVAMSFQKESGLRIGVARPVGEDLEELRHTAARNFGWGVGVIALALIGILPVAGHFTRDVETVTRGAERIAQGDLTTRLPVHSSNEFGQLANAFNRMAEDLSLQQQQLVEQEVQQRILGLEYDRKSHDLEDARQFQLSMLPKHVPQHERYEVAALSQTAAEVGGDYYDFHVSPTGTLSVTIGDATGHGAKAGTMVTVVKTLFAGYSADEHPSAFLGDAAEKIKRMDLGRMAMALALARFDGERLTVASAGMPPLLVHRRANGNVDEIAVGATPLGTLGVDYEQTEVAIGRGDTVLLMSDGLPELQNAEGQQLGYGRALDEFAAAAAASTAGEVIARLAEAARRWHGEQPPNDDMTFVVVRFRT